MIKVSLDEAYVFDMLAILDVKKQLFSSEKLDSVLSAREIIVDEICSQIGTDKFDEIASSDNFKFSIVGTSPSLRLPINP